MEKFKALRILITGSSSGIGFQAALQLYIAGHRLILPMRDNETAKRISRDLISYKPNFPDNNLPVFPILDLSSLEDVKSFSDCLLFDGEPIDVLILNAGLQYVGDRFSRRSVDNYELTFSINHLAHHSLTQRLLPILTKGIDPRLIITSSEVHNPKTGGGSIGSPAGLGDLAGLKSGKGFEMVNGEKIFDADKAYKDSKLCNILFAKELHRRVNKYHHNLYVYAWAPGLVIPRSNSGFFRYSRQYNQIGQRLFAFIARDLLKLTETPERAGEILKELSTSSDFLERDFSYYSNIILRPGKHDLVKSEISEEASNSELGKELWDISSSLIGISPDYNLTK